MDAANKQSYIGSGTTTHNIINAVNSGTFQDDTSFSTDQGGAFNFDGVDDYIQIDPPIPQATTEITINIWFKGNAQGSHSGGNYLFAGNPGFNHGPALSYDYNNETVWWGVYVNQTYNQATGFTQDTIWNACATFGRPTLKTYKNGILVDTDTQDTNVTYQNTTSGNRIGEWGYSSYQRNFNGQIYLVQVYNRELSAAEVLHNYNALKGRFE
jgi:hypothetical protein